MQRGRQESWTLKAAPGCWGRWRRGHFLSGGGREPRFPGLWVSWFLNFGYLLISSSLARSCYVTSLSPSYQMTGWAVERSPPAHYSLRQGSSAVYGSGFVTWERSWSKSGHDKKMAWKNGGSQLRMGVGWRERRNGHGWLWIGWQSSCHQADQIWAPSWSTDAGPSGDARHWWLRRSTGWSCGAGSSHPHPHPRPLTSAQHFPHCSVLTPLLRGPSSECQGTPQTCRQTSGQSPSWWYSAGTTKSDFLTIKTWIPFLGVLGMKHL